MATANCIRALEKADLQEQIDFNTGGETLQKLHMIQNAGSETFMKMSDKGSMALYAEEAASAECLIYLMDSKEYRAASKESSKQWQQRTGAGTGCVLDYRGHGGPLEDLGFDS